MRRTATLLAAVPLLLGLAMLASPLASQPSAERWALLLRWDGAIGPAARDYLVRGIERAERDGARIVVLQIDTPGGLDSSMRDMISHILNAEVPVATWVAPAGARAASAGTFLLYASHIAAMAPSTNLGAATPVPVSGPAPSPPPGEDSGDGEPDATGDEEAGSSPATPRDASSRKALNDAVAYIRSLAERRGRNAEFAERAVTEAATMTARQALDANVVDVVAADLDSLLAAIDGRVVRMAIEDLELDTGDLAIVEVEPDWRTELLAILTNPTLAYILLMVGIYGLILEGYNPGSLVPGVIGGICLLLALYAFQILPVNYAGLALIGLGLALIAVELFVPSFGILGIGGIVATMFGSVILFDGDAPGFEINTGLVAGMGFAAAVLFAMILHFAARVMRKPRIGGREAMIGRTGEAVDDFEDGRGRVHIDGEDWRACSDLPIRNGRSVRVVGMREQGLMLEVDPLPDEGSTRKPDMEERR